MPMPENETDSKNYQIIFATSKGKVRKNSLDDFSKRMDEYEENRKANH